MLHLASASKCGRLASRVLHRVVVVTEPRAATTTTTSSRCQSSWTRRPSQQQRRRYQVEAPLAVRKPTHHHRPQQVNGQLVPFHITELATQQQHSRVSSSSSGTPILAPPRHYDSDLVVVLDMDECLIHSQFLASPQSSSSTSEHYAHQLLQQQHQQRNYNSASATGVVDSFRFRLPNHGDTVHVHLRPGLSEFLDKVCRRFETHIFTAAKDIYANPLLDHIDPDGKLAGRWFRESCVFDARQRAYVKNLSHFGRPSLDRVVLVDNNPLSFLHQPENGILVSSFYNDATDTTLESVYQLLDELDESQADVRPVLEARFGLASALADLTTTSSSSLVGGGGGSAAATVAVA